MEQVIEFGLFFLKTAVIVIAILIVLSNIIAASLKAKDDNKQKVKFKNKSKEFKKRKQELDLIFLDSKAAKKAKKLQAKALKKIEKQIAETPPAKLFVLNFELWDN